MPDHKYGMSVSESEQLGEVGQLRKIAEYSCGLIRRPEDQKRFTKVQIREMFGISEWKFNQLLKSDPYKKVLQEVVDELGGNSLKEAVAQIADKLGPMTDKMVDIVENSDKPMAQVAAFNALVNLLQAGIGTVSADDTNEVRDFMKQLGVNGPAQLHLHNHVHPPASAAPGIIDN